jgi:ribosomal protein L19
MKQYLTILLKKNLTILITQHKSNKIMFTKKNRLSGRVLRVCLHDHYTKFEVSDYVKISKKLRSNVVEHIEKDILKYNLVGICLSFYGDPYILNTSFLIRNVFDSFAYEFTCPYQSPIVDYISVLLSKVKIKHLTKSKYYYLRKKPLPLSEVIFEYVIDMHSVDDDLTEDNNTLDFTNAFENLDYISRLKYL